jgi:hypothetical protein
MIVDWNYHPSVREWKQRLPQEWANSRFSDFLFNGSFSDYQVTSLAESLSIPKDKLLAAIVDSLSNRCKVC